jgi:hypothetical protein
VSVGFRAKRPLVGFSLRRGSKEASNHGMIFLAFAAMVIMITLAVHWSWWFTALVLVTCPIGAIIVFERLRREGVPEPELR